MKMRELSKAACAGATRFRSSFCLLSPPPQMAPLSPRTQAMQDVIT
jgi:hypothetical protein